MMRSRWDGVTAFFFACICLTGMTLGQAPAGTEYHLKATGHGDLVMTIPAGWSKSLEQGPFKALPPTLKLTAQDGAIEMMITPLWSKNGDPSFNSPENIRKAASAAGAQMLEGSKETSLVLHDIEGEKAKGSYFMLTDKAPAPGSFEYMTSAFVGVGDLLVSSTILHHAADLPARQKGLDLLKGLKQDATAAGGAPAQAADAAAPASDAGAELRIKSPDGSWELIIPGKLTSMGNETNPAHTSSRMMAGDEQTGLTLSVYIEPADSAGKSTVARAFYWKRMQQNPMPKQDVQMREVGDKAIVEYMLGKMEGLDIKQMNMNVYLVHDGSWVDVHISKVGYSPKDKPLFDAMVNGIKIAPASKAK